MIKKLKYLFPVVMLILFGLIQYFSLIPIIDTLIHDDFLASERKPMDNIIIVGMDETSIREIGTYPWPRFYMADAILRLTEMDVAAIGISVWYDSHGAIEEHDNRLVEAAKNTERLVLGASAYLSDSRSFVAEEYILPFHELAEVSTAGFMNVLPDSDGVMRHALTSVRYGDITIHSLPLEVYRTYTRTMGIEDNIHSIPLDNHGLFPINYAGGPESFTRFSLWDVLNEQVPRAMFKDAIVLIGPYAQGIGDRAFPTPLSRQTPTYGVEINANIIQNILEGRFKQDAAWWLNLSILLFTGLIVIIFIPRLKPLPSLILTVILNAAVLGGAKLAYEQFDIIFKAGDIIVFLIFCFVGSLALGILAARQEKNHIHGLFGRFVAPEVVSELMSGGVDIKLGGIEKEITVLFVDIRGFTAFSEANPPEKVVSMVNRYLALTSSSIQEQGGTLDKYIGDATMAVFNAPNDLPDHALRAVRSAWIMKEGAVALQEEILRDYGVDLQFGIGVNTGIAVVGNMGSDFRMDYTAIGDTVNTAARLESNATKGQVILSDSTYQLVKDHVQVEDMGILNVKNKQVGIQIYNLLGVTI
ncbi:MAG: adenylate/guanylate cyclase domain-containing protein [Oscillospiraceae bacterium]|nr:adenylate/guanylate cyclase domain-containing protein [Oscillospiraceae bacterium]